jgi:Stage II sporulation protein E (SpoIIE)
MRLHSSLLGLWLACGPVCGFAQVVDLRNDRVPTTELHGLVRFHTGDDPDGKLGWADPDFDDSHWPLIHIDQPWTTQGFQSDSGFAWYRFQMFVPAGRSELAIYEPESRVCYEIFIDGHRIAQYGGLPPNWSFPWSADYIPPVFRIPDQISLTGRPVEVALRVWHWPHWTFAPPGLFPPPIIGDARLLKEQRELRIGANLHTSSGDTFLTAACILGFCAGLGLFLLRRGESEYLWFAFAELGMAAIAGLNSFTAAHALEIHAYGLWQSMGFLVFGTFWPTFLVTFLKEPRRGLYWAIVLTAIAGSLAWLPFLFQWISAGAFIVLVYLVTIPAATGPALLVWGPARRGNIDARMLLLPQLLYIAAWVAQGVIYFLFTTRHFALALSWQDRYNHLLNGPFTFSVQSLVNFLAQAAVLAIIVLRFARKSRDEERYKNELEAARVVQQVLVPAENPSIPGFAIEAVYKPAGQVGGDFYQIIPTASGGVLVAIGDVSGKGMPAAMTVSLLVGTFRTLAHYTQSPGEILRAMNQRMLARSQGGFTTCLVIRVDADGVMIAANAGHIPPYLNGKELAIDSGLPLGLSPESIYGETACCLEHGARLTLLTDGVVEARSEAGELFGFERAATLSPEPAQEIAQAAEAFGQEDDITVLTLTFAPAEVLRA